MMKNSMICIRLHKFCNHLRKMPTTIKKKKTEKRKLKTENANKSIPNRFKIFFFAEMTTWSTACRLSTMRRQQKSSSNQIMTMTMLVNVHLNGADCLLKPEQDEATG